MIKLEPKDFKNLLKAAAGEIPADLLLKNGRIINVFTGEILPGNIYISQGFIVHVEYDQIDRYDAADHIVDLEGQYVSPGFIDSHMHIESSMLTPRHFAEAVIPHGTTNIVTDPHEIGNVLGIEGVRYMHESSADLPMRQLIDIPSCVPSLPGKEFTGADFTSSEILQLASLDRVIGLAEVMDFLAVIHGGSRMMKILDVARSKNLYLQGHAPAVSGRMLSAYLCGGPCTDHESSNSAEAYEKYRAGMYIDMRESSITKNVNEIWKGLKSSRYFDTLCLCTDDRESEDLLRDGHINAVIRTAVEAGMNPVDAIKSSTINTAREIHMEHLGAIAPGYTADICVLPDLKSFEPSQVYYGGTKVAEHGVLSVDIPHKEYPLEKLNTMNFKELKENDFVLNAPIEKGNIKVNIISMNDHSSAVSQLKTIELPVENGHIVLNNPELKFIAVVNRFGMDHIAIAVVENSGLMKGCIASTVSHDSHNLTIVYDTPEDALKAASALKECKGGLAAVEKGKILSVLPLPIAGLLSDKDAETTASYAENMKEADRRLGMTDIPNPLLRTAVFALPVIPFVKMTDMGMIDVLTKKYIPIYPR